MRVIIPDKEALSKLRRLGMEDSFFNTFANADFLVVEEKDDDIIGVAGVGGLFHIGGIFVDKKFRGKGISTKLNKKRDEELKNRGYSFFIGTTYSDNPSAKSISNILKDRKARPVFTFAYSKGFATTLFIQEFNTTGRLLGKMLDFFNSKFGTLCLAMLLKVTQPVWNQMFLASSANYKKISIMYSVKNFNKVAN